MKNDGKDARPSAAASDTVPGDVVPPQTAQTQPAQPRSGAANIHRGAGPAAADTRLPADAQRGERPGNGRAGPGGEQQRHENPAL